MSGERRLTDGGPQKVERDGSEILSAIRGRD
jgi:hypothetical protein